MGRMDGFFNVTGSVSNLSFYKMKGSDKIIVRTKGGASKAKIKRHRKFQKTRELNSEWGGCSQAGAWIRNHLWWKQVADYNVSGPINGLMKRVQVLDTENEKGRRSVLLSKNPRIMEGFSFNKTNPLESIIRNPVRFTLSREDRKAMVTFPQLIRGVNFFPSPYYSLFQLSATLLLVPDFLHAGRDYKSTIDYDSYGPRSSTTDWFPVDKTLPEVELFQEVTLVPPDDRFSLLLGVALIYGKPVGGNSVEAVKGGAAKIIAAG